ncbi:response regulator transcription factor [Actinoplanes sp. N902-109]|uniref:response regulator transcription factor n=1 Tax=Actinoplanes sp. (strain N902-109) TaxID=649831 RepID=UPI000329558B|nr:response regulator [Actinoplanes sp. N902-109]AGL18229.1 response regulator [Actinoplanes sp. N902-109]
MPVPPSPATVWDGVRPPAPPSILVADDDEDILDLVAFKLRGAGYRTITASDGLTALDLAERERPGLMILDVSMPGLDGLTVCHAIHRSAATWDIPVLILSARARPYDIDLGFAIGADDYLTKPFSPTELLQRVESLLTAGK